MLPTQVAPNLSFFKRSKPRDACSGSFPTQGPGFGCSLNPKQERDSARRGPRPGLGQLGRHGDLGAGVQQSGVQAARRRARPNTAACDVPRAQLGPKPLVWAPERPGCSPLGPAGTTATANPASRRPGWGATPVPRSVAALLARQRVGSQARRLGSATPRALACRAEGDGGAARGQVARDPRAGAARSGARTLCAPRPPAGKPSDGAWKAGAGEPQPPVGEPSECADRVGVSRSPDPRRSTPSRGSRTPRTPARAPRPGAPGSRSPRQRGPSGGSACPSRGQQRPGGGSRVGVAPLPTHLENPLALPGGEETPSPRRRRQTSTSRGGQRRAQHSGPGAGAEATESRGEPSPGSNSAGGAANFKGGEAAARGRPSCCEVERAAGGAGRRRAARGTGRTAAAVARLALLSGGSERGV